MAKKTIDHARSVAPPPSAHDLSEAQMMGIVQRMLQAAAAAQDHEHHEEVTDDDLDWIERRVKAGDTPLLPGYSDRAVAILLAARIRALMALMTAVYLPMDCPICGRHRLEWDGKHVRCEKCTTSSDFDGFTAEAYAKRSAP
jgi:hypothetical protein